MKLDLHVHSYASDGQLSPAAVAEAAVAGGLDVIALTDHDTAVGVQEAQDAAREMGLRVIAGIEVSTRLDDEEIHILGYFVDPDSPAIRSHQDAAHERRQDRMRRMVGKLQNLGMEIEYEDVVQAAGPETQSLGRPHLARALLAGGHTRYYGEAFARYIGNDGLAIVETDFPAVREAISTIHSAGGVAVWAHPPIELFDREIRRFAEWGLDGVECFRPNTPPTESLFLETAARELGLFPTGGSDWHAPYRARLGEFYLSELDVRELLDAGDARARA